MPSTSAKQHRFMAAIAHSPSFAKKVGVSQSVGKDFNAADKGKTFNKGGMMKKRRFGDGGATGSFEPREGETRGGAKTGMASKYKMPTDDKKQANADRIASAVKDAASMSVPGELARRAMKKFGGSDTEESLAPGQYRLNKGGMMKESKAMVGKEMAFMKKKGAPKSMIKHEKAEMMGMAHGGMHRMPSGEMMKNSAMKKGGMPMKDGKPMFMKKMNMGGMSSYAKGGGIESHGKTKGTMVRMATGGSVSSASRRADGIAQRGKTRC
jgi:hypothetical protein